MRTVKYIFQILPWLLLVVILFFWGFSNQSFISFGETEGATETTIHQSVLQKTIALGKIELVKYQFQEVTEVEKLSPRYLKIFKLGPDAKAVLISQGEAVGCIDLTKMTQENIFSGGDTIHIQLPSPELCYFKLNLDQSRLYSLETGYYYEQEAFLDEVYKKAEASVKAAALQSNILQQTNRNAGAVLKPVLEQITDKTIIFEYSHKPVVKDSVIQLDK